LLSLFCRFEAQIVVLSPFCLFLRTSYFFLVASSCCPCLWGPSLLLLGCIESLPMSLGIEFAHPKWPIFGFSLAFGWMSFTLFFCFWSITSCWCWQCTQQVGDCELMVEMCPCVLIDDERLTTTDWPITNASITANIIKTVSPMVRNINRWWWEYHRRFIRTSELITITTASSYQPVVIVHHHSRLAPPVGGDNVLLITAVLPYESALKTFFTAIWDDSDNHAAA
jgi:hypothetical protein